MALLGLAGRIENERWVSREYRNPCYTFTVRTCNTNGACNNLLTFRVFITMLMKAEQVSQGKLLLGVAKSVIIKLC